MEFDYEGPAELIDHEGNVVDLVTAALTGRGGSWRGHVQGPLLDGPDWTNVRRIRLETGGEGEISLEEEASWTVDMMPVHDGTLRTAAVTGSGRAPFEGVHERPTTDGT
jgi:hypothetical protein